MKKRLHIVCLDAPSPPDYGGAIDMHFKIKALAAIGHPIVLHYFSYRPGRGTDGLEGNCETIYTYDRKFLAQSLPLLRPYIVGSRISSELIGRLNKHDEPVLLEGFHCAGLLPFLVNPQRSVVRVHNDEASYYRHLAATEASLFRRLYFSLESRLLHNFQRNLDKLTRLACLSETDQDQLRNMYGFRNTSFVPCFLPWQMVAGKVGRGNFCLYHGNLQVAENEQAAIWLIEEVFRSTNFQLVVAGKNPPKRLLSVAAHQKNVIVQQNPSIAEIDALVKEAHINVLPSLNNTGVKLKLLNALYNGRHCLTNFNGVKGSGIATGVTVAETPADWKREIELLMTQQFSEAVIEQRRTALRLYDNLANAERLSALY